jgi:hypothetical protein
MEKTKVNSPMGPVDATELEFEVTSEPWTTVKLEDGSTLKLRLNVIKVFRLEQHDQMTGEPAYMVKNGIDMRAQVNPKLKKFQTYPAPSNQDVA